MSYAKSLTRDLQKYDRDLYVVRGEKSHLIMRKAVSWTYYEMDGKTFGFLKNSHQLVMYLTDNWSLGGTPVEWGLLPILNRIRVIDMHNNPKMFEELLKSYEDDKQTREKDFNNTVESFAYEFRDHVKRTFSDVNVGSRKF